MFVWQCTPSSLRSSSVHWGLHWLFVPLSTSLFDVKGCPSSAPNCSPLPFGPLSFASTLQCHYQHRTSDPLPLLLLYVLHWGLPRWQSNSRDRQASISRNFVLGPQCACYRFISQRLVGRDGTASAIASHTVSNIAVRLLFSRTEREREREATGVAFPSGQRTQLRLGQQPCTVWSLGKHLANLQSSCRGSGLLQADRTGDLGTSQ